MWRDATRDLAALRTAATEFFEEGFEMATAAPVLRDTAAEQQAEARGKLLSHRGPDGKPVPYRTVPDGCFRWIAYLVWLETALEIAPLQLSAAEMQGLLILRRERARFQADHPPCPRCGMPNEAHATRCRECMEEIGR